MHHVYDECLITQGPGVPMNIDEVCDMEFSNIRGITLIFDRKNPMR